MPKNKLLYEEGFIIGNIASKKLMLTSLNRLLEGKVVARRAVNSIRRIINNSEQQKSTITRKELCKQAQYLVDRFGDECGLTGLQKIGILVVLTEKGDLEDLYNDVGVVVE